MTADVDFDIFVGDRFYGALKGKVKALPFFVDEKMTPLIDMDDLEKLVKEKYPTLRQGEYTLRPN